MGLAVGFIVGTIPAGNWQYRCLDSAVVWLGLALVGKAVVEIEGGGLRKGVSSIVSHKYAC